MEYKNEIIIEKYNAHWPEIFKEESNKIYQILFCDEQNVEISNKFFEIHHIGSTAIPGMPAKPVIDIMIEFDDLSFISFIKVKLVELNYSVFSRHVIPHYSFFSRKQEDSIAFHLHIRERGDPQIKRLVHFRDYLIHHEEEAKEYAKIKIELAKQFFQERFFYTFGKDKFIQSIDRKAKLWNERRKNFLPQNMDLKIKNSSKEILLKAIDANMNINMTHFAQYLQNVELIRIPGYTIVHSGLKDDTFNYILEADFSIENVKDKIKEVTQYFEQKKSPFSWWVSPLDKPLNLSSHLEDFGYKNTENNIAMVFDLDTWNGSIQCPSELKIKKVTDKKSFIDFATVLYNDKSSFEKYYSWVSEIVTEEDPIEYFVGYVNNQPVVRGLSCYFGGVVGMYWLSTSQDQRKRGYATAMQQYRLKKAKDLGYHTAVLQASQEGFSLYEKLGWNSIDVFKEYKKTHI